MKTTLFILLIFCCLPVPAKEEQRKCSMNRDYRLYTPHDLDKNKTYWLVVGVHGHKGNGRGAAGLAGWISKYDNVIVAGPTFPSTGPYYQQLEGESEKQLLDLFSDLKKEFKLHDRMFIHGFSGGAQYVHRFAANNPDRVIGVSAHSGGTWESAPEKSSATALWTISCGLKDEHHSAGADSTRIEYFRKFCKTMLRKSFTVKPFVTDAGHAQTAEVSANAEECFRAATTGMFDSQREAVKGMSVAEREKFIKASNSRFKNVEFNDGIKSHKIKVNEDGWTIAAKTLEIMEETRRTNDKLNHLQSARTRRRPSFPASQRGFTCWPKTALLPYCFCPAIISVDNKSFSSNTSLDSAALPYDLSGRVLPSSESRLPLT